VIDEYITHTPGQTTFLGVIDQCKMDSVFILSAFCPVLFSEVLSPFVWLFLFFFVLSYVICLFVLFFFPREREREREREGTGSWEDRDTDIIWEELEERKKYDQNILYDILSKMIYHCLLVSILSLPPLSVCLCVCVSV
jgi:Ca2+/Na+ antiporter